MTGVRGSVAVLLAAVLLAGCSSGGGQGPAGPPSASPDTPSPDIPSPDIPSPAATGTASVAGSPAPSPTVLVQSTAWFRTPSGNIACTMGPADGVRCDVAVHSYPTPPKPADCPLDYGNGMVLGHTGARFSCAGDTVLGQGRTVGYGTVVAVGDYRCDVERAGVTCTDPSGRGFFLSRERAVVL